MLPDPQKLIKKWQCGRWFAFRGGKLRIRPVHLWEVPRQKAMVVAADPRSVKDLMDWETMRKVFNLALLEWENVWDVDGKKLTMTAPVKNAIFEHDLGGGVRDFVLTKSIGLLLEMLFDLEGKNVG